MTDLAHRGASTSATAMTVGAAAGIITSACATPGGTSPKTPFTVADTFIPS